MFLAARSIVLLPQLWLLCGLSGSALAAQLTPASDLRVEHVGAIGTAPGATFGSAVSLALGIGIQNFPEGLAVSMPLMREGVPPLKAFWYGQLSGLVEPIGGVLGAAFVTHCRPMLPYTMSLAAGAMIFVVCDSLVPEMQAHGNKGLAMQGLMLGFVVMMILDVALG